MDKRLICDLAWDCAQGEDELNIDLNCHSEFVMVVKGHMNYCQNLKLNNAQSVRVCKRKIGGN